MVAGTALTGYDPAARQRSARSAGSNPTAPGPPRSIRRVGDPDRTALWDVAFGATPGATPRYPPGDPFSAWLGAVALGGQGHYARAMATLLPLVSGTDPVLAALAAATLASHRRQLGGHAAARDLDGLGLRRLAEVGITPARPPARVPGEEGADAAAALSDVLLGLAADAVGLGRVGEARSLFGIESTCPNPGWRGTVRRGWVAAEIELAAGVPAAAEAPARAAAEVAADSGSTRHRIKSALVLGAVRAVTGDREEAHWLISGCARESVGHRLSPLRWPCALVLADLEPGAAAAHRRHAEEVLHCVLRHADPAGRSLAAASPWLPTSGFDLAPNR